MKIPTVSTRIVSPLSLKFILIIILLEIFLGGGGRLIDIGSISLRMYLFGIGLAISIAMLFTLQPVSKYFTFLLLFGTGMLITSSFIGMINGAPAIAIFNDIKPLLSFYSLLFFCFTIRDLEDVALVIRLIRWSSIILAIGYICIFVLINTGVIQFVSFYNMVTQTEEFFFRGEFAFFYKGFLYMCIGLLFHVVDMRANKAIVLILTVAIILTFTRGFFVSIVLTYLFYHLIIRKSASKLIIFTIVTAIAILSLWNVFYSNTINRMDSDSARIVQINEVLERVTPISFFIGHGFGIGVPSRPERMEITYLEMIHKQGLLGLLFWFGLIILNWIFYKRCVANGNSKLALPFMLAVIFVYVESLTNPYLTNPIGLTMVLISLVCLRILCDPKNKAVSADNLHEIHAG
ncbi:MAG TPA: hypothetical protein VK666_05725 [Chryseolinea sp.]|nr:hypothetical protein [Chryseolinea sp.]